jgi:hypothetical protein
MVDGGSMGFLGQWLETNGTFSNLYLRICREFVHAGFDPTIWLFTVLALAASKIAGRRRTA